LQPEPLIYVSSLPDFNVFEILRFDFSSASGEWYAIFKRQLNPTFSLSRKIFVVFDACLLPTDYMVINIYDAIPYYRDEIIDFIEKLGRANCSLKRSAGLKFQARPALPNQDFRDSTTRQAGHRATLRPGSLQAFASVRA